jgi:transcriptional regulator with XRE-family HTH domain
VHTGPSIGCRGGDLSGCARERLQHETGVHRNYIGGMERGERVPTVQRVHKLAEALGVSLGELFGEAER